MIIIKVDTAYTLATQYWERVTVDAVNYDITGVNKLYLQNPDHDQLLQQRLTALNVGNFAVKRIGSQVTIASENPLTASVSYNGARYWVHSTSIATWSTITKANINGTLYNFPVSVPKTSPAGFDAAFAFTLSSAGYGSTLHKSRLNGANLEMLSSEPLTLAFTIDGSGGPLQVLFADTVLASPASHDFHRFTVAGHDEPQVRLIGPDVNFFEPVYTPIPFRVDSYTNTYPNYGYTFTTYMGARNAVAVPVISAAPNGVALGDVVAVKMIDTGQAYVDPPIVTCAGASADQPLLRAHVEAGRVTSIEVLDGGSGFFSDPFLFNPLNQITIGDPADSMYIDMTRRAPLADGTYVFDPHRILESFVTFECEPNGNTYVSGYHYVPGAPGYVEFYVDLGEEFDTDVDITSTFSHTVGGLSYLGITTSQYFNLSAGQQVTIIMDANSLNPQYNGVHTVLDNLGTHTFYLDIPFGNTVAGNETGQIIHLQRYVDTTQTKAAVNFARPYDRRDYPYFPLNWLQTTGPQGTGRYLTNYTRPKQVRTTDVETVTFMYSPTTISRFHVQTFDADNNVLATHTLYPPTSTAGLSYFTTITEARFDLLCGPANLKRADTTLQDVITPSVTYYDVYGFDTGTNLEVGERKRYTVCRDCPGRFPGVRFAFLNRLGGFDYYTFDLVQTPDLQIGRTIFDGKLDYYYPMGDRVDTVLTESADVETTVTSGWISKYDGTFLQELFDSTDVYVLDYVRFTDFVTYEGYGSPPTETLCTVSTPVWGLVGNYEQVVVADMDDPSVEYLTTYVRLVGNSNQVVLMEDPDVIAQFFGLNGGNGLCIKRLQKFPIVLTDKNYKLLNGQDRNSQRFYTIKYKQAYKLPIQRS